MKVKNLLAKVLLGLTLAASFVVFANVPTAASGVRDYNGNAIIYGGSYSVTELTNQLNKGTGHPNQSAAQLTDLFAKNGIYTKDFGQLKDGIVTKDGRVIVGNKVVATGVTTMGRHFMAGSTQDTRFSYPIYLRRPSVSFLSNSMEAFVSMNFDGSYAYAVLKPCGNIVKGPGVKVKPVTYKAYALKWIDANGNGRWDKDENARQANVPFTITGNGVGHTARTDSMGYAYFYNLKPGTYTFTETVPLGYKSTTGTVKTLKVTKDNQGVVFGNTKIVTPKPEKVALEVRKFNDCNGNKVQDNGEVMLAGWSFNVTGPKGFTKTITTGNDGTATLMDLEPGTYTVTEILKDGWTNTTGLTIVHEIKKEDKTFCFTFGNKQNVTPPPVTPPEVPTTVVEQGKGESLPTSGPVETAAGAMGSVAIGGASFAWLKSKKALLSALTKIK